MNDLHSRDPLASLLRTWRQEPPPAPDFDKTVWARIRSEVGTTSPALALAKEGNIFHFPSALPLAAGLAVLLSIAAGSGTAVALNRTLATDRMAAAYVRTIDPIQLTASSEHSAHRHP